MSSAYFSTKFKEYNGISLSQYIAKKRVQKAVRKLENSDKTVLSIAQNCGFFSSSNFYKAFKKYTGKVPTDYR